MLRRIFSQQSCGLSSVPATLSGLLRAKCRVGDEFLWPGRNVGGGAASSALVCARRGVRYAISAANFDSHVIQSQQAICLVYYIPNSSCAAYLRQAESLVDQINQQLGGDSDGDSEPGPDAEARGGDELADPRMQMLGDTMGVEVGGSAGAAEKKARGTVWLNLCVINADENRNLASAFSVERAKLPVTYFIMQGAIIDKVVGHVSASRLEGILHKFVEHYQKELNVDFTRRVKLESVRTGGAISSSPFPVPAPADLLQGASTQFMQDKIMLALVGSEMIQLPAQANMLDGLRKTLQQVKKKAHEELQELQRELGLHTRRLTDAELHAHYYKSSQFLAAGTLGALEALYLARSYAFLGDIARANVEWARRAVHGDFEAVLADAKLRRILALVDANLVRGDLRLAAAKAESGVRGGHADDLPIAALQAHLTFCQQLTDVIDTHVDIRSMQEDFPSATVDALFTMLRENMKLSKPPMGISVSSQAQLAAERVAHTKTILMCLINLFASDARSQAARSRLSSLLY